MGSKMKTVFLIAMTWISSTAGQRMGAPAADKMELHPNYFPNKAGTDIPRYNGGYPPGDPQSSAGHNFQIQNEKLVASREHMDERFGGVKKLDSEHVASSQRGVNWQGQNSNNDYNRYTPDGRSPLHNGFDRNYGYDMAEKSYDNSRMREFQEKNYGNQIQNTKHLILDKQMIFKVNGGHDRHQGGRIVQKIIIRPHCSQHCSPQHGHKPSPYQHHSYQQQQQQHQHQHQHHQLSQQQIPSPLYYY